MLYGDMDNTIVEDKRIHGRPRSSSFGSCLKDSWICGEALSRLQQNNKGLTPVSLMCYAIFQQNSLLLRKLLIKYPLAVNGLTEDGISPLHLAVTFGNEEILNILLVIGNANINILDINGHIPLEYAVKNGMFDTAQYLIQHGSHLFDIDNGKYI